MRVVGWCCLLRLLDALVETGLIVIPLEDELLLSNGLLDGRHLLDGLKRVILKSEVNQVFKAVGVFSIGVMEWTQVGTVIFLRMENGGKEEVLRGSLVFIHNNYTKSQKYDLLCEYFIYIITNPYRLWCTHATPAPVASLSAIVLL